MSGPAPSLSPLPPARSRWQRFWREWVLGAALPVWLVVTFLFTFARVDGSSMNPTLHSGDVALLLKYPRWLRAWHLNGLIAGGGYPRRGDIVVFRAPADSEYAFTTGALGLRYRPYNIKRVIGLPGDTVRVSSGAVYLDGRALSESYASGETFPDERAVRVPPGRVFVMGDNRLIGESVDSRYYGPVGLGDVAGVANLHVGLPGR